MCIILPPAFQYSPERSSSILLACCVLHNASLQSGLDAWTLERTDPLEQPESLEQRPEDRDSQAEELRKQLILKHFSWDVGWTNTFSFVDVKGDQGWIKGFILGWFHGYFSNAFMLKNCIALPYNHEGQGNLTSCNMEPLRLEPEATNAWHKGHIQIKKLHRHSVADAVFLYFAGSYSTDYTKIT